MIKTIYADGTQEFEFLEDMKKRSREVNHTVTQTVTNIINEVRQKGDSALIKYSNRFDGGCPQHFEVNPKAMERAYDCSEPEYRMALEHAAENIRFYHEKQVQKDYELKKYKGVLLGQLIRPLRKVGIYVPGGTAAYPSTVLMNSIPAKIAGVEEIIMVTPPIVKTNADGEKVYGANPDILAAAYVAGVDRVFLVGGAQSIAALTYGTESIPVVDKIVGPGNIFVATAKRLLYGQVDIDMIAGPSEILILADEFANPEYIAADLMSQAEHDKMAASILITTSNEIASQTKIELEKQMKIMGRHEIIEESLNNYGAIIVCRREGQMIDLANRIAPEHLEIMMEFPMNYLPLIKNAGSIFCGDYSPEPLGDYYSGTNHVLPTSGTARFSSPLGVHSFIKKMSYTYYTKEALLDAKEDINEIAKREGLTAHANSINIRF
ncbi:histidinol dehydrogenase [Anaerovorax odorimutans]|uniref:histidinol dehydrogenase n=1 Tax=Anaerovorax odorimutans TaxID=109327 RepID=UPI000422D69A|nr:histidinol dehydrogenase [Anaerovorax odorimutans]